MTERVPFRYYQITDRRLAGEERQVEILRALIAAGLKGLQIREKDLTSLALSVYVDSLLARIQTRRVSVLINADIDVALARGIGLHRPESGRPTAEARKLLGSKPLIGVSCHDYDGALQAQNEGADFITLGPVFATPGKGPEMGLDAFGEIAARIDIPVFALGGVNAGNAGSCLEAGAYGVAAIRATLAAEDPAGALKEITAAIGSA
jgi:thiamine-phosphate pyrophosphorylase